MKILKNVRLSGKLTDIKVEDGKFVEFGSFAEEGLDCKGLKIYPGLIDVHSHGCLGMEAIDVEDVIETMADYHLKNGTTTWYPTTTTGSKEETYRTVRKNICFGHGANIPGFHMEGPFINPKYRGAQNPDYIMAPSLEWILENPTVKRVTIAPELPGAKKFIENCPAQVTLGHTDADYDTAIGAFKAGARCLTHTFNAMNGIHHRAPGPIGAAADTPGVFCELICDGYHIHPSAVRMLVKVIGKERIVLISDLIRSAGLPDGVYTSGGLRVTVKDGKTLTDDGHIAGSTTNLFGCVKRAIEFGFSEEDAVMMASENPARMMGLNKGKIAVGYDADFILVDDDFNLKMSVARGEF